MTRIISVTLRHFGAQETLMNELRDTRFIHSAVNSSPEGCVIFLTLILVGERANPNLALPLPVEG